MVSALVFIPVIDLAAAVANGGEIAIHIPYIVALGGGTILYARFAVNKR